MEVAAVPGGHVAAHRVARRWHHLDHRSHGGLLALLNLREGDARRRLISLAVKISMFKYQMQNLQSNSLTSRSNTHTFDPEQIIVMKCR